MLINQEAVKLTQLVRFLTFTRLATSNTVVWYASFQTWAWGHRKMGVLGICEYDPLSGMIVTVTVRFWETGWWTKDDVQGHKGKVDALEAVKETHWWWHPSPEQDNRDLLAQHLGVLPPLLFKHTKPSSSGLTTPSSSFLPPRFPLHLFTPTTSPLSPLSGVNVNTLTGAEVT